MEKSDEQVREAIAKFGYDIYDLKEYDYDLPKEQIAQTPAAKRDESRLLVIDR
ncbi:MAG TPA: tRNA preQ1(34) S-adenosylmethionine ribosyltransferase-isomerase QueA, partial [Firmicutes bacterium]|nr:tRNA preQ1(34) S-adenosylmethionine ribosyltransferase-isomerase QueA [Bacillota bacterium]